MTYKIISDFFITRVVQLNVAQFWGVANYAKKNLNRDIPNMNVNTPLRSIIALSCHR